MINRAILVGRLTKEPVMRKTSSGASVASFTLAISRKKSKDSTTQEADFISCIAWNQAAELLCQYMHKGSQIGVEGRIQTRSYDDTDTNKKVYVTEVVCESITFLESKQASEPVEQPVQPTQHQSDYITADDLPF